MESIKETVKKFDVNMDLVDDAYVKLPVLLEKLSSPDMRNEISDLVGNYEVFISEIKLISSLIISQELNEEHLLLLKNNYEPLYNLLGDDINLLDNLIAYLTPESLPSLVRAA